MELTTTKMTGQMIESPPCLHYRNTFFVSSFGLTLTLANRKQLYNSNKKPDYESVLCFMSS